VEEQKGHTHHSMPTPMTHLMQPIHHKMCKHRQHRVIMFCHIAKHVAEQHRLQCDTEPWATNQRALRYDSMRGLGGWSDVLQ
jgi:hypothetical protein